MNLYKLAEEIEKLIESIDLVEPEYQIEISEQIEALGLEHDSKVENIGLWVKRLASEVEQWKAEEDRISKERKSKEDRIDYLKEYLALCMGKGVYSSPIISISAHVDRSVKYSTKSTSSIPEEYVKTVERKEVDTSKVKEALDSGISLSFARYIEKKRVK